VRRFGVAPVRAGSNRGGWGRIEQSKRRWLMKDEQRPESERTPEEIEHFALRKKVTWMIATRTPVFFPPSGEDGLFGRPRKEGRPRRVG
jgi:hypothetical protein